MQRVSGRRLGPPSRDPAATAASTAAASSTSAAADSTAAAAPAVGSRGKAGQSPAYSDSQTRPNTIMKEEVRLSPLRDCLDAEEFPFLHACAVGDVSTARRMLTAERAERGERPPPPPRKRAFAEDPDKDPDSLLQRMDGFGWSALHYACAFGHLAILELLYEFLIALIPPLERPADAHTLLPLSQLKRDTFLHPFYLYFNRTNNLYDTPLHVAAYNCHTDCMRWLLERGADLLIRNSEEGSSALGHTALMCAAEQKEVTASAKQVEAVRFLCHYIRQQELEEWADDPQADADSRHRAALMRQAIQQQSNLTGPMFLTSYCTLTLQQQECTSSVAAASPALAPQPRSPPTRDSPSYFEEESKSESVPSRSIPTASAARSTIDVMTHSTSNEESKSADSEMPAVALMQDVVSPSFSAAASAADSVCDLDSACAYLASYSSINACRGTGSSALMMAVFGGDIDVVRVLLQWGALVEQNLCTATGRPNFDSALLNAVECGYPDIARLLLQWGANRTTVRMGETAVLILCDSENHWFKEEKIRLEFLHLLCVEGVDSLSGPALRSFLLNTPDPLGRTPLSLAVRRGYLSVVRWLVDHGCAIPTGEDSVVAECIDRVAKQREKSTRHKKTDVALCSMLQIFLQLPRCAAQLAHVTPQLRAYVQEVCDEAEKAKQSALEAAAALAVANAAARRERKRERAPAGAATSSAAAAPAAAAAAKLKESKSVNSSKRPKHAVLSTIPAPSSPHSKRTSASKRTQPAAAASKPLLTPTKAANVAPATPSQTTSPARWFKGGKLHDHSSSAEASSAGNASREPSAVSSPLGPLSPVHSEESDVDADVDDVNQLEPDVYGADHSFDSEAMMHAEDGPASELDLIGELNHSQVADHLLNSSDESAHTHAPITSHLSTPHHSSLMHGASDDDPMHDSAGHEDRLHLSMPTSPLKFTTSASPFRSPQPTHFGLGGSGGGGGAGSGAGGGLDSRHSSQSVGSRHAHHAVGVSSFQSHALLHSFDPLLSPSPPARHQPPLMLPHIISTQSTISSIMTSNAAAAARAAAEASGSMILSQEMGEPILSAGGADVAASTGAAFNAPAAAFTPAPAPSAAASAVPVFAGVAAAVGSAVPVVDPLESVLLAAYRGVAAAASSMLLRFQSQQIGLADLEDDFDEYFPPPGADSVLVRNEGICMLVGPYTRLKKEIEQRRAQRGR